MNLNVNIPKNETCDDATLLRYNDGTDRPVISQRKRDLCHRVGIELIHLEWEEELTTTVSVHGFQPVSITMVPRGNGQKGNRPMAIWKTNPHTNEPMEEGALQFVPDETNIGHAYLPKSDFNMFKLGAIMSDGRSVFNIVDPEIKKEAEEIGARILESPEYKKAVEKIEEVRAEANLRAKVQAKKAENSDLTPLGIKNEILQDKIKVLTEEQKHRKLLADLEKIKGASGMDPDSVEENSAVADIEGRKNSFNANLQFDKKQVFLSKEERDRSAAYRSGVRQCAKLQIYAENMELVAEVQEEHRKIQIEKGKKEKLDKGWAVSGPFMKKIRPLIDVRAKELFESGFDPKKVDEKGYQIAD